MKGKHHVIVDTKRLRYEFDIRRNITIIQGDSATGKTTLVDLLDEFASVQGRTGISLQSDVPCVVFRSMVGMWQYDLKAIGDSIIFIDEEHNFVRSKEFAEIANGSSNYFVIITRSPLPNLPYSVNEIYGIRCSGKYHYPEKIYHEFYPIYAQNVNKRNDDKRILVVEDAKAGYQFFSSALPEYNCVSARGNSSLIPLVKSLSGEGVTVIADGAAFGAFVEELVLYKATQKEMEIYLPESFEWLVLKSGVVGSEQISDILAHPEEYIESSEYFSWERYFTHILEESTVEDPVSRYHKDSLSSYYLEGRNKDRILDALYSIGK